MIKKLYIAASSIVLAVVVLTWIRSPKLADFSTISQVDMSRASHCSERPKPMIRFEPRHMQTGVDGSEVLVIRVNDFGREISRSDLNQLALGIGLIRWPTGEPIAISVETTNATSPKPLVVDRPKGVEAQDTSGGRVESQDAIVSVQAKNTLANGWYVIQFSNFPKGLRWSEEEQLTNAGNDFVGSKFYVGANPSLLRIEACDKSDGKVSISLEYSEDVHPMAQKSVAAVSANDKTVKCDVPGGGQLYGSIHTLLCENFKAGKRQVHVNVNSVVSSVDGTSVAGLRRTEKTVKQNEIDVDLDIDGVSSYPSCRLIVL